MEATGTAALSRRKNPHGRDLFYGAILTDFSLF